MPASRGKRIPLLERLHRLAWFAPKRFGWGLEPSTWQGWLVLLIYVGLMALVVRQRALADAGKLLVLVGLTAAIVVITFVTAERDP